MVNQLTEQQIKDLSARVSRYTGYLEECVRTLPFFQQEVDRYTDHVEKTKACIQRNEKDLEEVFKMIRGQAPYQAEEK